MEKVKENNIKLLIIRKQMTEMENKMKDHERGGEREQAETIQK